MMARKTKKYVAGYRTILENKLKIHIHNHEEMYQGLEAQNWFWNPKQGIWEHKEFAPSTSIFEADDGTPTGIVKIRVMAHPDDMEAAIVALKQCPQWRVIEISEKSYKNRKGSGYRLYTTVILDGAS